jgi:Flp pilus assembly protein TadD
MDGRIRGWAVLVFAVAVFPLAGCRLLQNEPTLPNATLPVAGQQRSGLLSSSPKYGPPPEQVPVREARKKNQPFRTETFIAIGDAELEAAFDDNRTGADRDQLIDVARQRYVSALQQDPKNKEALLGLVRLYTWANDRERALQTLQEAMKHHPKDRDVAFALVRTQVRFQDWDGACRACDNALSLDPENRQFTKALGYCQARAERWDDAFGTLLKVMPESEARTFLGRTLIDIGRTGDGQQQLQLAIQNDPQNEIARVVLQELQVAPNMVEQAAYQR